ncbi:MAG: aminofutalosine synthase MqnE [Syntrophomonadaceae bacterium]|nr:aminofutalosine synthase MqnE [Syntrophomonadaceae bacterium]
MATRWEGICEKVRAGQRLDREEGLYCFEHPDLLELGALAREVKRARTGREVYFNVNRHLNLTNVCVSRCKFCAFGKDPGDAGAYVMSVEEAVRLAREALPLNITELHVVSGLHPELPFEYYLEVVGALRREFPGIHIQAFTAVEIQYFSDISGLPVREVLLRLKDAGLGSLPGGGAEILKDELRVTTCPRKATSAQWLEVHRTAHQLGLRTNCTMLYGHIESRADRIDHMLALRELQDETGGFQAFIPLPFHPENTAMSHLRRTSAVEDLRTLAVSRLVLDNIDHIKAFWIMLGIPVAQVSLEFGVDDLDGTVVEERITHAAGATTEVGIAKEELLRLIREAGWVPVERDTVYRVVQRFDPEG